MKIIKLKNLIQIDDENFNILTISTLQNFNLFNHLNDLIRNHCYDSVFLNLVKDLHFEFVNGDLLIKYKDINFDSFSVIYLKHTNSLLNEEVYDKFDLESVLLLNKNQDLLLDSSLSSSYFSNNVNLLDFYNGITQNVCDDNDTVNDDYCVSQSGNSNNQNNLNEYQQLYTQPYSNNNTLLSFKPSFNQLEFINKRRSRNSNSNRNGSSN